MDKRIKKNASNIMKIKLSTESEVQSLSLRKQRIDQRLNIKREQLSQNIVPQLDKQKFYDLIKLLVSPISIDSILTTISHLSFIFTSNCVIDPVDYFKSEFVQAINYLIQAYQSNSLIMSEIITLIVKATSRNDPEIKKIFLQNTNMEDCMFNYYSLLEFSLTKKESFIQMLTFFINLLSNCESNQRKFVSDYKKPHRQIFQTIQKTIDIAINNNINQDFDVIHSQICFMASFSEIDYSENNNLNVIFAIRKYLFYIIENKDLYLKHKIEIIYTALWGISYQAKTIIEENLFYFFNNNRLRKIIYLFHIDTLFKRPIIEIIGNIATNEPNYINELIKINVIDVLINELGFSKDILIQERLLWALSNIAAESDFIDLLFKKQLVPLLITKFNSNPPYSLIKEIWWTLQNLIESASPYQCIEFLNVNMIELILNTIRAWKEPYFIGLLIDCLRILLSKGKIYEQSEDNIFLNIFNDLSGIDIIERIFYETKNKQLLSEAYLLIHNYGSHERYQKVIQTLNNTD